MAQNLTFPVATSPVGVSLARNSATPLDATSVRKDKADAEAYAAGTGDYAKKHNSYVGQILSVLEDDTVNIYKIVDTAGTLVKVGNDVNNTPSTTTVTTQAATLLLNSTNITISGGSLIENDTASGLDLVAVTDDLEIFSASRKITDIFNDIKRGKIICLGGQLFYTVDEKQYVCVISNIQIGSDIKLIGTWYKQNDTATGYDCISIGLGAENVGISISGKSTGYAIFDNVKLPPQPKIIVVSNEEDIDKVLQELTKSEVTDEIAGTTKTVMALNTDLTIQFSNDGTYNITEDNAEIDLAGYNLTIEGTGVDKTVINNLVITENCEGTVTVKNLSVGDNIDLNMEV